MNIFPDDMERQIADALWDALESVLFTPLEGRDEMDVISKRDAEAVSAALIHSALVHLVRSTGLSINVASHGTSKLTDMDRDNLYERMLEAVKRECRRIAAERRSAHQN